MKLIIVESPNKVKKIQEYVGDSYVVLPSYGHICDLAKGGRHGIGVDIQNNFKPHYMLMKDKVDTLNAILNIAEKSDEILLACDEDFEGEAICNHINRYLLSTNKPVKRIKFSEITKSAILKALDNPMDIDQNIVKAQEGRRILDRIIGFMVSPFLMNYYGSNLSAGRVQSVAVRMIVDRENDIQKFIPEEFWNIYGNFSTNNNEKISAKFKGKTGSKNETQELISLIKEKNDFYVHSVVSSKKKEKPVAPLTTASLLQYMAKKFGFEPERTMKAAQSLYENGLCTYIRTDSTRIAEESLAPVRKYIVKSGYETPDKPNVYVSKSSAQDAHECIRPTDVAAGISSWSGASSSDDDKEVYGVIWKYFVASQMKPAIWDTMNIIIKSHSKDKLSFTVSGKALSYKGYLEILGDINTDKIDLPLLKNGDELKINEIKSEQKFTQALPRYNVATILEELELKQIGRPATYADITQKIEHRNYVEKKGSTYRPTDLGIKITNILVNFFPFMEYDYSALMEQQLDDIAAGKLNRTSMLESFFNPFKIQLNKAYMEHGSALCEKCKSPMVKKYVKETKNIFWGCSSYPHCKFTSSSDIDMGINGKKSIEASAKEFVA
jgi:DNA topoisomerase I